MAVYTQVSDAALAELLADYDLNDPVSLTGIEQGIENSNFRLVTTGGTYLLTIFERRTAAADLPYFLALTDHLADRDVPAPRAVRDRAGRQLRTLAGKPSAIIQFLAGTAVEVPSAAQASAAGAALARLHLAAADFGRDRANQLGPGGWRTLLAGDAAALEAQVPGIGSAVAAVTAAWPRELPVGTIHADLFPDNVLMDGDAVTGLIDFYFACTDLYAYDLAVMHSAWAFATDGGYRPDVGAALVQGYETVRPLSVDERAAMPLLAQGACLRFTLTRAWDWANTPRDALVTRKDPLAYWRRYIAYRDGVAGFA